ncbi:MAG: hypothetical protein WBE36_02050 [Terracidiphilus sp.]
MKRTLALAGMLMLAAIGFAQTPDSSSQATPPPPAQSPDSSSQATPPPPSKSSTQMISPLDVPAFSRVSVGAELSPLGIGLQVSTDVNRHLNLRGIGNIFSYSANFTTSGIPITASLTLGSGGVMADYYPSRFAFRVSGGVLFINENGASATASIPGGDNFKLDGQTYYSSNANPLTGTGNLALNSTKPGAVFTTGWGNHVGHKGHFSIPFEIGAAFVGSPKVSMALSGTACTDQAQTMCTDIASSTNPIAVQFQSNLNSQIAKWNSDLNVLEAYPIISVGIAYSWQTKAY